MTITYGSVCSGIEAASMAWRPLGWQAKFFSEIEAFPSAVLAHHYGSNMPGDALAKNGVPNYGDFTQIPQSAGPIDLLVGGTPCQSFSVAGKRLGLDDPRGNLALEYLRLARRLRARWIVWENVPGVLSSVTDAEDGDGDLRSGLEGRSAGDEWIEESDFATFLSFVRECGYGFAYRVLDAQYVRVDGFARAVPQRRRRVFLVGYLGDWRRAAAILLEPEGLRGDPAPRREAGKGVAGRVAPCLDSSFGRLQGQSGQDLNHGHGHLVAHALRDEGFDVSEDGTGRGTPIVPVAFQSWASATNSMNPSDIAPTLDKGKSEGMAVAYAIQAGALRENPDSGPDGVGVQDDHAYTLEARAEVQAVAFDLRGREGGASFEGPHETANIRAASGGSSRSYVAESWAVRRLMPPECERLQGFPDGYTNVPWRGKPGAPDGPRYKALGNSMAVNVMRWIGERIDLMERLDQEGRLGGRAQQ
jgi:DNA (cytosine-5)-methyltransferase 1